MIPDRIPNRILFDTMTHARLRASADCIPHRVYRTPSGAFLIVPSTDLKGIPLDATFIVEVSHGE